MKIKKFQSGGGVLPFNYYTPVVITDTSTASTASASKSDTAGKLTEKDLFTLLSKIDGLPSDVEQVISTFSSLFNQDNIFSVGDADISDISTKYLSGLQAINRLKFNKSQFDQTQTLLTNNKGTNEVAISTRGKLIVRSEKGLEEVSFDEYNSNKDSYVPVTNNELLRQRAYGSAFDNSLLEVAANGIGMEKVASLIKSSINSLGTMEMTKEGYSKTQSNRIIEGFQILQEAANNGIDVSSVQAINGLYKNKLTTKSQAESAAMALEYAYQMLPPNAKTLLKFKTGSESGARNLVANLIASSVNSTVDFSNDLILDGEGNKPGAKTSTSKSDAEKSNPYLQMIREQGGYQQTLKVVTKKGNEGFQVTGTWYGSIPKVNGPTSVANMLQTGLNGIVKNQKGITFGDQELNPEKLQHVLYDGNGGTMVTLPMKYNENGVQVVNLNVIEDYRIVNEKLQQYKNQLKTGQISEEQYNKIWGDLLKEAELFDLVKYDGTPDLNKFGQFLVVDAYTTDKFDVIKDKDSLFIHKVKNPDPTLEQFLIQGLSTDNDKSNYDIDIDDWGWFEGTWNDIYKANLYIPVSNNPNSAVNAWGDQWKEPSVDENELSYQRWSKRAQMKNSSPSGL